MIDCWLFGQIDSTPDVKSYVQRTVEIANVYIGGSATKLNDVQDVKL